MSDGLIDQLLRHVDLPVDLSECWIFRTGRRKRPRTYLCVAGRDVPAARVSFELYKGVIPAGFFVARTCRNLRCVNPEHLAAKTPAEAQRPNRSKLTWAHVDEIRSIPFFKRGELTALAVRLGVAPVTIQAIRKGRRWKRAAA